MQLSKHQGNLRKVSKPSDFVAGMNAVRDSWIAEHKGEHALLCNNNPTLFSQLHTNNQVLTRFGNPSPTMYEWMVIQYDSNGVHI